jgi:hypothetical protein
MTVAVLALAVMGQIVGQVAVDEAKGRSWSGGGRAGASGCCDRGSGVEVAGSMDAVLVEDGLALQLARLLTSSDRVCLRLLLLHFFLDRHLAL